jgi:serum/glucocorticoid-regulated kinase 2
MQGKVKRQASLLQQLDFEKVCTDRKIQSQFESGEVLVFSLKIVKFTGHNKAIPRILAITTRCVYTVLPTEEANVFQTFMQSISNQTRVRRKIPLSLISSVTVSTLKSEFILHVPTEYDQRFMADTQ